MLSRREFSLLLSSEQRRMKPTLIGEGSRRIGVETVALSGAVSTGVNAQVQITETVQVSYYIP